MEEQEDQHYNMKNYLVPQYSKTSDLKCKQNEDHVNRKRGITSHKIIFLLGHNCLGNYN